MKYLILLFTAIFCCYHLSAQEYSIKGKIVDKDTQEPLPFVIVATNENRAVVSDIDGLFSIHSNLPLTRLSFRYTGYSPVDSDVLNIPTDSALLIRMQQTQFIPDFTMEKEAVTLLRKVVENRDRNNPEKNTSFSYTSYNKLNFGLQEDTLFRKRKPLIPDTLRKDYFGKNLNLFLKNHFFLMEFVTQRFFRLPDKDHEDILSTKTSGFSDPSLAILGTQMQSFGFYQDMITLMDKIYLNPISKKSSKKYLFSLAGKYPTENEDTLYVISFIPKGRKKFNGLKGILYINSNGYAVQNVMLTPANPSVKFSISVQQSFRHIDGRQWFPSQLNIDLAFRNIKLKSLSKVFYPIGNGKTYLRDVQLNPDFSKVKFNEVEVRVAKDAGKKPDTALYKYRPMPLSGIDSTTYRIIDSLGRAKEMEKKIRKIDALISGYVPVSIFNVDYRKYISYNKFEGFRFGAGLMTNEKVSSFFSMGGYFAYGTHDKKWKYSPTLVLFPSWSSETKLSFNYTHDVWETGQYSFFEDRITNSSEWLRNFWVSDMNMVDEKEISLSFRTLQYLKVNLYLNQSLKHISNYEFLKYENGIPNLISDFHFTEVGISLKFAYKEKFVLTPSQRKLSLGTSYPMIWLNLKKGIEILKGQFSYTKYEIKVSDNIPLKLAGESKVTLVAGKVSGDIPVSNLYFGRASYQNFGIEAENSFGTMRFNEFVSSEFASLFIKQNFGPALVNLPIFHPDICLVTNIGIGKLQNPASHIIPGLKTLDKGYYESGFLINKILNQPILSLGAGVLYRYGPYSFTTVSDNFAYKITLDINL